MIQRNIFVLFALSFSIVCFAAPLITNDDAKTGEDDGIKISLEKLKFIPAELLCTLCHRVVIKLQHDLQENPMDFQINMLKSCDHYPDLEDQVKCKEAFTNRQKIEQLLQPEAATKMCRTKLLCKKDELPMETGVGTLAGPRPLPPNMHPIPEVKDAQAPNEQEFVSTDKESNESSSN
uniref:Saposin B-type domain-containing protein n=1 Tax=Panagrolaimus superbus TaxID=310955 RepID=A0A914YBT4_9BILA